MTRAAAYRSRPARLYPRARFELSFHQPSHMDIIIILLTLGLGTWNTIRGEQKRLQKRAKVDKRRPKQKFTKIIDPMKSQVKYTSIKVFKYSSI